MSRAIQAGRAEILLSIRDQTQRGLNQAQRSLQRWASTVARIGLGLTATGAGIAGIFVPAIRESSKLEQLAGRFRSVFAGIEDEATEVTKALADKLNLTPETIAGDLSTFQSFFRGLGFEAGEALSRSLRSLNIAQDLFAADETAGTIQELVERLQSAQSGQVQAGRRLRIGVDLRKEGEDFAAALAEVERTTTGLSTSAKESAAALLLIEKGLRASGIEGQALREVNTVLARQAQVTSQLSKTWAAIGDQIRPIVGTIGGLAVELLKVGQNFAEQNSQLIQGLAVAGPLLIAAGAAATVFATGLAAAGLAIGAVTGFGTFSLAVPIAGMTALAGATALVVANFDTLRQAGATIASEFNILFPGLSETLSSTFSGIVDAFSANDLVLAGDIAAGGIELAFEQSFGRIKELYASLVDFIAKGLLQITPPDLLGPIAAVNPALAGLITSLTGIGGEQTIFGQTAEEARQAAVIIDEDAERRRKASQDRINQLREELEANRAAAQAAAEIAAEPPPVLQPELPEQIAAVAEEVAIKSTGQFGGLTGQQAFAPVNDRLKLIADKTDETNSLLGQIAQSIEETPLIKVPA